MPNSITIPLPLRTTAVLSFIAGFVDSAGVICLFGLMPAHITGYLVTAGQFHTLDVEAAVGGPHGSRILLVAVFMVAVVTTTIVHRWLEAWFRHGQTPSLVLCALSLSALAILGCTYGCDAKSPADFATTILSAAAITCMAVQNTLLRISNSGLPPTTVMTGNAVQVLVDVTDLISLSSRQAPQGGERKERLVRYGTPLAGFCIGIGVGSFAALTCGFHCFMLPTAGAIILAVLSWRSEGRARPAIELRIWRETDDARNAAASQAPTPGDRTLGFRTCA